MAGLDLNVSHGMEDGSRNGNSHFTEGGRCVAGTYQGWGIGGMLRMVRIGSGFQSEARVHGVGRNAVGDESFGID